MLINEAVLHILDKNSETYSYHRPCPTGRSISH